MNKIDLCQEINHENRAEWIFKFHGKNKLFDSVFTIQSGYDEGPKKKVRNTYQSEKKSLKLYVSVNEF